MCLKCIGNIFHKVVPLKSQVSKNYLSEEGGGIIRRARVGARGRAHGSIHKLLTVLVPKQQRDPVYDDEGIGKIRALLKL